MILYIDTKTCSCGKTMSLFQGWCILMTQIYVCFISMSLYQMSCHSQYTSAVYFIIEPKLSYIRAPTYTYGLLVVGICMTCRSVHLVICLLLIMVKGKNEKKCLT